MSPACQLIVNADDLGCAPGRDRGIFRCAEEGIVTSVSLFANGATFDEAVREVKAREVAVGVHLNLSEGRPLTGPIRGLTDEQGNFLGKERSRAAFAAAGFDRRAVSRELHRQVQRVVDAGVMPDHVDTHQHMFLFPALTPLVIELCRDFEIGATRLPLPAEGAAADPQPPLGDELRLYRQHAVAVRQLTRQAHLFTPDALWGMPLLDRLDEPALLEVLNRLTPGCWELMVHPGDEDEGLPFCGVARRLEQEALMAASVRQAIEKHAITLTTFGAAQCAF